MMSATICVGAKSTKCGLAPAQSPELGLIEAKQL